MLTLPVSETIGGFPKNVYGSRIRVLAGTAKLIIIMEKLAGPFWLSNNFEQAHVTYI